MSLFRDGMDWLAAQQKEFVAESIRYTHNGASRSIMATVGRTQYSEIDNYGTMVDVASIDFIVSSSDINLTPQSGDTVTYNNRTYKVLSLPSGNCWRWSGLPGTQMRIHTKEVE